MEKNGAMAVQEMPQEEMKKEEVKLEEGKKYQYFTLDENGLMVDCQLPRVDFTDPGAVATYGNEARTEVATLLTRVAALAKENPKVHLDAEMIKKISSFDEILEEADKKELKNEKKPKTFKLFKGIFGKVIPGAEEKEKRETSFAYKFEEYRENLRAVCEAVEAQNQGEKNDLQLRNDIIKAIEPQLKKLEEVILVGKYDLAVFDAETAEMEAHITNQRQEDLVAYRKGLSELMLEQIVKLEESLVSFDATKQQFLMQQLTGNKTIQRGQEFIQHQSTILTVQAGSMVFAYEQGKRIDRLTELTNAANTAMRKNADVVNQNAEKVVDLELNGGITSETLKYVHDQIKEGIEIYEKGAEEKAKKIRKDQEMLEEILKDYKELDKSAIAFAGEESFLAESLGNEAPQKKYR